MNTGSVPETNDPRRVCNAFRLANTALDADHTVEVFLLGDDDETPDPEHEQLSPRGVVLKDTRNGGERSARGTCLDSRDIEADDLRPRATTEDCLRIVGDAEKVLAIG